MSKYETTHTAFLGIDLDLLENPKYADMDARATMLYALYKDRAHLSLYTYTQLGSKKYIDKNGVFIVFKNELAAKILHTSVKTIGKFRKQLSDHDLITIRRNGLKGYKIYVSEVQRTPKNVHLLMPWKNHHIEVKKVVSDWTLTAQLKYWSDVDLASKVAVRHVEVLNGNTCNPKTPTSIYPKSLTTNKYINNNDLIDNACAREEKQTQTESDNQNQVVSPKYNSYYHKLPETLRSAYNNTFGFISKPIAKELYALCDKVQFDMVIFAINNSKNRQITSPIAYIKKSIATAVAKGAKTVQDMISQNEERKVQRQNTTKPRHYSNQYVEMTETREEFEQAVDEDVEALKDTDPALYKRVKAIRERTKQREQNKPVIPIFSLDDDYDEAPVQAEQSVQDQSVSEEPAKDIYTQYNIPAPKKDIQATAEQIAKAKARLNTNLTPEPIVKDTPDETQNTADLSEAELDAFLADALSM